jgi:hypothetical protein
MYKYLCIENNVDPCVACKLHNINENGDYGIQCWITWFNEYLKTKEDIKKFILDTYVGKNYLSRNIKYLYKSIELFHPQYINYCNKIQILM